MQVEKTLGTLMDRGFGDLIVLHTVEDQALLGNIIIEKGKPVFRDNGCLRNVRPAEIAACEESGVLGAVCSLGKRQWESLTFMGVKNCHIRGGFTAIRSSLLKTTRNQYGDALIDFEGSVYRGFQLMLNSNFLPVVLLKTIKTTKNRTGLTVCDLRMASVPSSITGPIHSMVRASVEQHLTISVQDVDLKEDEFHELFGNYLKVKN